MRIPVLSAISAEWTSGDKDFPLTFLAAIVLLWACAFMLWGLPALTMGALILVPICVMLLARIAWG